jgi:hypothetical protein
VGASAVFLVKTTEDLEVSRSWHHLAHIHLVGRLVCPTLKDELIVLRNWVSGSPVLAITRLPGTTYKTIT